MIVIIGGGISGLALAHQLEARGRPFLLLESSDRVGGVMRSGRVDGHLLEWGPQRGRLTREFSALVDDLDIRGQLIKAPTDLPLFVYRRNRLRRVPFSIGAFLARTSCRGAASCASCWSRSPQPRATTRR
jgi:protoporphyrinogen/coproporphyrinogen III oxidase